MVRRPGFASVALHEGPLDNAPGALEAGHEVIGGNYGIRSVLSGLRILEECVSPDAMLGFEG